MNSLHRYLLAIFFIPFLLYGQQKETKKIFKLDGNEVQYSINGGSDWVKLKLPFDKLKAFCWDANAPDRMIAGVQGGLNHSNDCGATWHNVLMRSPKFTPKVFSVSQKNPHRMYCAGVMEQNGSQITEVFQSMNGGMYWLRVMASKEPIEMLTIAPDSPTQKFSFSGTQLRGGK